MVTALVDRASANDAMQLTGDAGSVPMQVGALLVLDADPGFDVQAATTAVADRIRAVPRLRRRLVPTPLGCGRAVWVDDADFDIGRHVRHVACPSPGDEQTLLAVAADIVTDPLPRSRPLWAAVFVTGLADDRVGLVVVFHHALADGIGGLAVLVNLVDGMPPPPAHPFPTPPPSRRRLACDAWSTRWHALSSPGAAVQRLRAASAELLVGRPPTAPRTSLNRPTGPRRRVRLARADLAAVADVAHRYGGTVNDVALTAVAGALGAMLTRRGEPVDALVMSIPVSARASTTADQLGNQIGVMPVTLPTVADRAVRLGSVIATTRARKTAQPGASAALLGPAFRAVAALRLFHWMVDHQRLVNTFVTNVRGPDQRLNFLGTPITDVVPITIATGNVSVAFAVLSYAGVLTVAVTADRDACPDLDVLCTALQDELDHLVGLPRPGPAGGWT